MPKSAWFREFEECEYRAYCARCREVVMPSQVPYFGGKCHLCWSKDEARYYWGAFLLDVLIACERDRSFAITTRSASGWACEVFERVFRRLEQPKRLEVYRSIVWALRHVRKTRSSYAPGVVAAWRKQLLARLDDYYLQELKPKRVVQAEPKRKIRSIPGQLSLFEGDPNIEF